MKNLIYSLVIEDNLINTIKYEDNLMYSLVIEDSLTEIIRDEIF